MREATVQVVTIWLFDSISFWWWCLFYCVLLLPDDQASVRLFEKELRNEST